MFYSGVWECELEELCWFEMKLHIVMSVNVTDFRVAGEFEISYSSTMLCLGFDSLAWT